MEFLGEMRRKSVQLRLVRDRRAQRGSRAIAPCSSSLSDGVYPPHARPCCIPHWLSAPKRCEARAPIRSLRPEKAAARGKFALFSAAAGSCGRVGGRSPGHFRHCFVHSRALTTGCRDAVIDHRADWRPRARDARIEVLGRAPTTSHPRRPRACTSTSPIARQRAPPRDAEVCAIATAAAAHAPRARARDAADAEHRRERARPSSQAPRRARARDRQQRPRKRTIGARTTRGAASAPNSATTPARGSSPLRAP